MANILEELRKRQLKAAEIYTELKTRQEGRVTPQTQQAAQVISRGQLKPAVTKPPTVDDTSANPAFTNVIDLMKYLPFGLAGGLVAAAEHATGKTPTTVSELATVGSGAFGLPALIASNAALYQALQDKGQVTPSGYLTPAQVADIIKQYKPETPEIKFPSFGDLKNVGLIAAAAVIGVLLFTRK